MNKLSEAIGMEKAISALINDLKQEVSSAVSDIKQDGVKQISSNIVSVSFSNLDHNMLCPSYYIQTAQATVVEQKLSGVSTATDFIKRLNDMIENKRVKINGNTTMLNQATIQVLKTFAQSVREVN